MEDGVFGIELDYSIGIDSINGGEFPRDSEYIEGIECGGSLGDSTAGLRDFGGSVLGVVEQEADWTEWKGRPRIVKSRETQLNCTAHCFIGGEEGRECIYLCRSDSCIGASRGRVNILNRLKGTLTLLQIIDDPMTLDVVWNHQGIVTCR